MRAGVASHLIARSAADSLALARDRDAEGLAQVEAGSAAQAGRGPVGLAAARHPEQVAGLLAPR